MGLILDESLSIDNEALGKLSALAKAHEDANNLKRSELNILRRKEQEALQQIEETAKLRHEVQRLINELDTLADEISAYTSGQQLVVQEVRQLKDEMEHLQSSMVLLLTEHSPAKIKQAADEIEENLTLKKQLRQHRQNLARLEEQAAKYGSLDVPLKLQNSIDAEREKLAELEEKIAN